MPDKDLVNLCPRIEPYQVTKSLNYYHHDHGCSQEQAQEISRQFRALAVKISQIDSLYDLKIIYQVVTVFTQ